MSPFDYSPPLAQRKHGPQGYASYASFLPWLRDEFSFRCVYCLSREQWIVRLGGFVVEHFSPSSSWPHLALIYDNLLYACNQCNLTKGAQIVPDPTGALVDASVEVREDGTIEGRTTEACKIIDKLKLNSAQFVRFRRNWIVIVRLARQKDPAFYRELMSYPAELPDLSRLRPPGGNSRPEGVQESCFARRERGELAEMY
jgi:hypothetical protein